MSAVKKDIPTEGPATQRIRITLTGKSVKDLEKGKSFRMSCCCDGGGFLEGLRQTKKKEREREKKKRKASFTLFFFLFFFLRTTRMISLSLSLSSLSLSLSSHICLMLFFSTCMRVSPPPLVPVAGLCLTPVVLHITRAIGIISRQVFQPLSYPSRFPHLTGRLVYSVGTPRILPLLLPLLSPSLPSSPLSFLIFRSQNMIPPLYPPVMFTSAHVFTLTTHTHSLTHTLCILCHQQLKTSKHQQHQQQITATKDISTNASAKDLKVRGPVRLPTKTLTITTRKTPCGEGSKTWDRYQMRIHKRILDLFCPVEMLKAITNISVSPGVEIEITLTGTE